MLLISIALALASPALAPPPTETITSTVQALRAIARNTGDAIWPGYGDAPFGVLLIAADGETLLCDDRLPDGFKRSAQDPSTGCNTAVRGRSGMPTNLLAAMPVFGPPSTIVMGTPETTGYTRAEWRRTVLHEHFHQWQAALPGYYRRIAALDLADGDATDMWMLNFAFPYDQPTVDAAYRQASLALRDALLDRGKPGFKQVYDRYLAIRAAFAASVDPRSWRYLEFQLWQEGGVRWTEIAVARRSGDAELEVEATRVKTRLLARLGEPDLKTQRREMAYPFGAGEALLLDACGPNWRTRYPGVLGFGDLLLSARRHCRPVRGGGDAG